MARLRSGGLTENMRGSQASSGTLFTLSEHERPTRTGGGRAMANVTPCLTSRRSARSCNVVCGAPAAKVRTV